MKAERFLEGEPVETKPNDDPISYPLDAQTRQDIFDRVVRHYRQKRRRCPPQGGCLYFSGYEENMCFVGPLIEAHYTPCMEGHPVRELLKLFVMPSWFRIHIDFIEELQRIHDNETNWGLGVMDMVLEMFAADRGLTMPA